MLCIICDRCKAEIESRNQVRKVKCYRPLKRLKPPRDNYDERRDPRTYELDPPPIDLLWEYELCLDCANAVEEFLKMPPDTGDEGGDEESPPVENDDSP